MTAPVAFQLEWKRASRSNLPVAAVRTADTRAWWLHSQVDPEDEATYLIADVPVQERSLYVVLGFGLGYHVHALLDRVPANSHVIVIESDAAVFSDAVRAMPSSAWMATARLQVLVCRDPAVVPLRLAASFSACDALALHVIPHVPTMQVTPEFYQAAMQSVREQLPGAAAAHVTSLDAMLEHDLRNFWANLSPTWRGGDIDNLKDTCRSCPVIVVSAGPSLSEALPHLAALAGRAVVVATAPTVTVLLSHGVRPDIVVTVDPYHENLAHFVPWHDVPLPLVYYHRAYRGIFDVFRGPACAFSMREEQPLPLKGDARPSIFFPGGSVAFSALQLAHHIGGNPIVLVGQDFAFADGRTHASGVDYGREVAEAATATGGQQLLHVPGVKGAPVTTNGLYYSYLLHMQEYLLAYRRHWPDVRHLNASSGAVIQGAEHIAVEQLASVLPGTDLGARGPIADAIANSLGVRDRRAAAEMLRQWQADLANVLEADASGGSFQDSFDAFARTSLYAQAPTSYRRVRYVFDSRYAPKGDVGVTAFHERWRTHLCVVADVLTRLAAEYAS
ncbi:MAG: 6-hydroxymethylpterin diphosphokinase MptE-like protein [Vicinamibacterales bacterium]